VSRDLTRGGRQVTPEQAAIVDHVVGQKLTVVDAGAGSGKTYTTVATVLELIELHDAHVDQFVLITFTRKAADELRRRLSQGLQERQNHETDPQKALRWSEELERVGSAYVGTIHGFCRWVLRAFGHGAVAREAEVSVGGKALLKEALYDAIEEALEKTPGHPLLREASISLKKHELEGHVEAIYEDIRNQGLEPANVLTLTKSQPDDGPARKQVRVAAMELVVRLDELYTQKKKARELIDAADLLNKTAKVLEDAQHNEPAILAKLTARYRYLFVDEFQDTDRVQVRIVETLLPGLRAVLLVGDIKQSIYGFRGAGVELAKIAEQHKTKKLPLSISRRPTMDLLKLQNVLFASIGQTYPSLNNPLQLPTNPVTGQSELPSIGFAATATSGDSAAGAAATAASLQRLLKIAPEIHTGPGQSRQLRIGDIAILFRANWALEAYETELRNLLGEEIPVRRDEGGSFYRRPEVIAVYRILRLVLEYPDEIVLSQALHTPYLRTMYTLDPAPAEATLLGPGRFDGVGIERWVRKSHPKLDSEVQRLQAVLRVDTAPELLEKIYSSFNLRQFHEVRGEFREVENLERLREIARTLTSSTQSLTARFFLDWLHLRLLMQQDEPDAGDIDASEDETGQRSPHYIRLMTVHGAKGLEFPVVILPQMSSPLVGAGRDVPFIIDRNDGLDLNLKLSQGWTCSKSFAQRTLVNADVQRREAMRVFYVAVTRARNAIIFVGTSDPTPHAPTDKKYSWQSELLQAWPDLSKQGAKKRPNK